MQLRVELRKYSLVESQDERLQWEVAEIGNY